MISHTSRKNVPPEKKITIATGAMLLALCLAACLSAQTAAPILPEDGFISPSKYTNAFFGFALPIPQNTQLHSLSLPSRSPSPRFLFGVQSQEHGITALTVTAAQTAAASSEDARKAASGPKGQSAKRVEINGKEFWKSESQDKSSAGKMRTVKYATALAGYVLEFNIVSFNSKLTDELEQSIESVTFFDPATAKDFAGPDSQPFPPGIAVPQPSGMIEKLSPGTISGNMYTNNDLGFSFGFPEGWHLADQAAQEKVIEVGHQAAWGDNAVAAREHELAMKCIKTLLWATQYSYQDVQKGKVNPLVVALAMDPGCAPGASLPNTADDPPTIRKKGEALVHALQVSALGVGGGEMKFGTLTIQNHFFLEADGVLRAKIPEMTAPIEAHYSFIMTTANKFWLVWMFETGSEADLRELKRMHVTFEK